MIYFKDQPDLDMDTIPVDLTLDPIAIYVNRTKLTYTEAKMYKYILCPCTNYRHLVPCNFNKVIYLDDAKWLYSNVYSTMEYTLTSLLNIVRTIRTELKGQSIGMIGYGRVAQQLAKVLIEGFNCKLHVIDPKPVIYGKPYKSSVTFYTELEDVLQQSILLMLASEQPGKKPILTKANFENDGYKIVINPARSSLISECAIAQILNNGGWYISDTKDDYDERFIVEECLPTGRVIITPHVAGSSIISRVLTDMFVIDKFVERLADNA